MRIRDTSAPVYRLKVTLKKVRPPIWRRFLVPSDISLARLHDCLQAVMPWSDAHLHLFEAQGVRYGDPDPELGFACVSESRTKLKQVLRHPKDRLTYEYDFGDYWLHDVVLEAVLLPAKHDSYPVIEAGRRACPPEDVGGINGYGALLEALDDPSDPEHVELLDWVGETFDPDAFDVEAANAAIQGGGAPRRK
jgi:hypothetical protein